MNWIEINEDRSNLPKVHVDVLVTVIGCETPEMAWLSSFSDKWIDTKTRNTYEDDDVIAWMPLPELFKKRK
jgi:hypothetical protein